MGIFSRKVIVPDSPEAEASMSTRLGRPSREHAGLTILWPGFAIRSDDPGTLLMFDVSEDEFRPMTLFDVVLVKETVEALVLKHGAPLFTPDELAERNACIDPERRLDGFKLKV